VFKTCFGHQMGPLETADLIGLDTILFSIEVLYENVNDSKFRPCPLLKKMVDAGLHGRKSGRGFYQYSRARPHRGEGVRPHLCKILRRRSGDSFQNTYAPESSQTTRTFSRRAPA